MFGKIHHAQHMHSGDFSREVPRVQELLQTPFLGPKLVNSLKVAGKTPECTLEATSYVTRLAGR